MFGVVLAVMKEAKPAHVKRLGIIVVVSLNIIAPTDLTGLGY